MKQRIVLLGPPASGKGTQAEMIRARYGLPVTSPGAILREECRLGTPLGMEAEKATRRGELVSDSVVNLVVRNWLERHDSSFVFDGYPRSLGQASALAAMLVAREIPLEVALLLDADLQTIRDRVRHRMMCSECGQIVSIGLHVGGAEAPCPSCGGALIRRLDDSPETLETRMREYAEKTAPLVTYYGDRGLLRSVNAARDPEVVFVSIAEILEGA